jgi:hypothetical protein
MPAIPSKGPEISVKALRGINLRKSPSQLDEGECDRNFGLYPSKTGLLSRMPGKQLMRVFEDGTTPREVLNAKQAFGTGIIIQNGDALSIFTLDELRNRVQSYSLAPSEDEALAILGAYGSANGGALGALGNTFYALTTPRLISDADSVVVSVVNGVFRLPLGTYRIDAKVSFGQGIATAAKAGLYNVTNAAFQTHLGGTAEIIGTAGRGVSSMALNQLIWIKGRFEVSEASEAFAIHMAQSGTPSIDSSLGYSAAAVTGHTNFFQLIKIYRE